jgi:hypothetical protein
MKTIFEFDVAWVGWEGDYKGGILEDSEGVRYLTFNSGKYPHVENDAIEKLEGKVKEYERLVEQTKKAIDVLKGN